jgi:hypothetical protein
VTIWHLLSLGRPIIDFKILEGFFSFLKVPNTSRMHWFASLGWGMAWVGGVFMSYQDNGTKCHIYFY